MARQVMMAQLRFSGGRYEACCEHCGAWQAVTVKQLTCDMFFEYYRADFTCCGTPQAAQLAVEKDELDFH
jgi:hypothetical protein